MKSALLLLTLYNTPKRTKHKYHIIYSQFPEQRGIYLNWWVIALKYSFYNDYTQN